MLLYVGDQMYKVHIGTQTHQIKDTKKDLINYYIKAINDGIKGIDDVPELIKADVEKALS
jgi:hypothetical protein